MMRNSLDASSRKPPDNPGTGKSLGWGWETGFLQFDSITPFGVSEKKMTDFYKRYKTRLLEGGFG